MLAINIPKQAFIVGKGELLNEKFHEYSTLFGMNGSSNS